MATRDYETLKGMIIGGGRYNFEDGTSVSNSQDFVDKIVKNCVKMIIEEVSDTIKEN